MINTTDAALFLIEDRLAAIFATPNVWGTPEAVELQVLLLVEIRHVLTGERNASEAMQRRFTRYIGTVAPGNTSLASRLGLKDRADAQGRFVETLRSFAEAEANRDAQSVLETSREHP